MWSEQFKDKEGTKYRYYEKYKDPYTDKWKRVSIVMKILKASQKEAVFQLDDKISNTMVEDTLYLRIASLVLTEHI